MSIEREDNEYCDDEQLIESWIRGAGGYVRPGDGLRGDIIESVRVNVERKDRWRRWLASAGLAASFLMVVIVSGSLLISAFPRGRTADDQFARALSYEQVRYSGEASSSFETGSRLQWALSDVFHDWRRVDETSP